jgi:sulfur relay (sulfurtransferase) DsrC/TusE family protein
MFSDQYVTPYVVFFQDFKRAGVSRLLKEKGREQFGPKKGNLRRTRKNLKNGPNFTTFRVNKMFSLKF